MGAVTRMQIEELANRNEEPDWFLSVCADITNGSSVDAAYAKLTNDYAVSWGAFRTWVKADEHREELYQAALSARAELRREQAAASVAKVAGKQHADDDVTVADTLKAASMVLGDGTKPGISVSVGAGGMTVRLLPSDAAL